MEFRRRTKKLSGLPIAFYVVALLFFVLLFSFNSLYYKASEQPKPVVVETPKPIEEPKADSIIKPQIYVPDVEVLPPDTVSIAKETPVVKEEEKKKPSKAEKADTKLSKKDEKKKRQLRIQKMTKSPK
jgi:MinD-like ATPase involved in chromosome partitioning or flagellar assembly